MTPAREPFVSGLPSTPSCRSDVLDVCDAAGLAVLHKIRSRAAADAALLAPLVLARFDGVERIQPDPQDIEAKVTADATLALVDGILASPTLLLRVAAMLARGRE